MSVRALKRKDLGGTRGSHHAKIHGCRLPKCVCNAMTRKASGQNWAHKVSNLLKRGIWVTSKCMMFINKLFNTQKTSTALLIK